MRLQYNANYWNNSLYFRHDYLRCLTFCACVIHCIAKVMKDIKEELY